MGRMKFRLTIDQFLKCIKEVGGVTEYFILTYDLYAAVLVKGKLIVFRAPRRYREFQQFKLYRCACGKIHFGYFVLNDQLPLTKKNLNKIKCVRAACPSCSETIGVDEEYKVHIGKETMDSLMSTFADLYSFEL